MKEEGKQHQESMWNYNKERMVFLIYVRLALLPYEFCQDALVYVSAVCSEKERPEQITHKESVHQPFTSHTAQPTVQRPKSAYPLRLIDPLAPLNDALRSRGGVRVDASAPRD